MRLLDWFRASREGQRRQIESLEYELAVRQEKLEGLTYQLGVAKRERDQARTDILTMKSDYNREKWQKERYR